MGVSGYKEIYCCACQKMMEARLTNGKEIYPHRPDLADLPFWKCDACGNYVGCHHKTKDRTHPLGNIATPEIRNARQHIHRILDPLWHGKGSKFRQEVYDRLSELVGWKYHTAKIRTIEEARSVYAAVKDFEKARSALEPKEGKP